MFASVDLLLKTVDRVIQLLSVRAENRRRTFKEVIEPMFRDLEPVVDDYFAFFILAMKEVQDSTPKTLPAVIEKLRQAREQNLIARKKVQQLAEAMKANSRDDRVVAFASLISSLFFCTQETYARMSGPNIIVELLDDVVSGQMDKQSMVQHIKHAKDNVASKWIRIVQAYGVLRLQSMQ